MKKLLTLLFAAAVAVSLTLPAFAQDQAAGSSTEQTAPKKEKKQKKQKKEKKSESTAAPASQ